MITTIPRPDHDHQRDHDHGPDGRDHDHDHGHSTPAPAEKPPSGSAVLFDIGAGIGALIVELDDGLAGTELPIDCHDDSTRHIHTGVWRRTIGGTERVVAIYPELPQGHYGFPHTAFHTAGDVLVESGAIARLDLRTR